MQETDHPSSLNYNLSQNYIFYWNEFCAWADIQPRLNFYAHKNGKECLELISIMKRRLNGFRGGDFK